MLDDISTIRNTEIECAKPLLDSYDFLQGWDQRMLKISAEASGRSAYGRSPTLHMDTLLFTPPSTHHDNPATDANSFSLDLKQIRPIGESAKIDFHLDLLAAVRC